MNAISKTGATVLDALDSPKGALGVSSAMISGGLATKLAAVSSAVSSIALILGCILTAIMIVVRVWKFRIYRKDMQLKMEERKLRIKEMRQADKG